MVCGWADESPRSSLLCSHWTALADGSRILGGCRQGTSGCMLESTVHTAPSSAHRMRAGQPHAISMQAAITTRTAANQEDQEHVTTSGTGAAGMRPHMHDRVNAADTAALFQDGLEHLNANTALHMMCRNQRQLRCKAGCERPENDLRGRLRHRIGVSTGP